jgi:hypothetical protein
MGTTAYPHRYRPIHHRLLTRTTTGTCGSGGIRVLLLRLLHADNGNGGWRGVTGAGNTSSVRNLDVDKVGAVMGHGVMMVIIVVERIKRSR